MASATDFYSCAQALALGEAPPRAALGPVIELACDPEFVRFATGTRVWETAQDRLALARAGRMPSQLGGALPVDTTTVKQLGAERDSDRRAAAAQARDSKERSELEHAQRRKLGEHGAAKEKQSRRAELAEQRWIEKGLKWRERLGLSEKTAPPSVSFATYCMVQEIEADASGGNGRRWVARFARRFTGVPIALIREAALEPLKSGGTRFDWSDPIARHVVACGLLLLAQCWRAKRRKDRWQLFVRGLSVGRICGVMHRPGNPQRKPHRNSIGGAGRKSDTARDNAAAKRWAGHSRKTAPRAPFRTPLQRLRDTGFLYAIQAPRDVAEACEVDSRGNVRNRYWLATAGLTEDAAVLHVRGWDFGSELSNTPLRATAQPP